MTRTIDQLSGLSLTQRQSTSFAFMQGTVEDVIRSPDVYEFCIGISADPARRRGAYARWCRLGNGVLRGFVLLDWAAALHRSKTAKSGCSRGLRITRNTLATTSIATIRASDEASTIKPYI